MCVCVWMTVSCHLGAWNRAPSLLKSNKCSYPRKDGEPFLHPCHMANYYTWLRSEKGSFHWIQTDNLNGICPLNLTAAKFYISFYIWQSHMEEGISICKMFPLDWLDKPVVQPLQSHLAVLLDAVVTQQQQPSSMAWLSFCLQVPTLPSLGCAREF